MKNLYFPLAAAYMVLMFMIAGSTFFALFDTSTDQQDRTVSEAISKPIAMVTQTPQVTPTIIAPPVASPCWSPCGALAMAWAVLAVGFVRKR